MFVDTVVAVTGLNSSLIAVSGHIAELAFSIFKEVKFKSLPLRLVLDMAVFMGYFLSTEFIYLKFRPPL